MSLIKKNDMTSDTDSGSTFAKNRNTMASKNSEFLRRYEKLLESHRKSEFVPNRNFEYNAFKFVKINSIMLSDRENAAEIIREQTLNLITALCTISVSFSCFINFDGSRLSYYIGSLNPNLVSHLLEGCITGAGLDKKTYKFDELISDFCGKDNNFRYAGFFTGNPVVKIFDESKSKRSVLDSVVTGTYGTVWTLAITAIPVSYVETAARHKNWIMEMTKSNEFISADYNGNSGSAGESISTQTTYTGSKLYNEFAVNCAEIQAEGLKYGQWNVSCVCFSDSIDNLNLFGGLYSSFLRSGNEETIRPLPYIYKPIGEVRENIGYYLMNQKQSDFRMSSLEVAAVMALPVCDGFGFAVKDYVKFDISSERNCELKLGKILNNTKITDEKYSIDPNSLNRHGLIVGLTGGGKTNTVKSILDGISNLKDPIPFLVIEPAKKEYYELYKMGMTDLQVYSLGSLNGNSIKLNPFECMPNVPLQFHIDAVFAAFKASFTLYSPMPYVLETAIYEIYNDYGWNIETGKNIRGESLYPTIEDLYYKIGSTVKAMGYDQRMRNDLIGSLTSRINSLRIGSKGNVLNIASSTPIDKILSGKVVIELEDIGDEDAKAFIMSLILMRIQEYRKSEETQHQSDIQHLLLIEEAHRLLKNIPISSGENTDPRGAAVEYFCNMLAELRSKGQGFLVIDQIPSKLTPDLVKNTNLKIIHRTVEKEDRQLIGGAMHMTDEQIESLACLKQGTATVYSEGDNRPKLVKFPNVKLKEQKLESIGMSRKDIIERTNKNIVITSDNYNYYNQINISRICAHCPRRFNCANKPNNVEYSLQAIQPAKKRNEIISGLYDKTSEKKALDYITSISEADFDIMDDKSIIDIRRCLAVRWVEYFSEKMDYLVKSSIIEILVRKLS